MVHHFQAALNFLEEIMYSFYFMTSFQHISKSIHFDYSLL